MSKLQIKESFSWMTPDMKVNDAPGNKVIIRGPALFSVEKFLKKGVSKNLKRYMQREIERSARTLIGVPLDVNHEISLWEERGRIGHKPSFKGHCIYGEEEGGVVEYVAEVNHKEYAQKVRDTDKVRKELMTESDYFRKWSKKPLLGVSVDADFLKMKCISCGEDFYDFELYKNHMSEQHHVKSITIEPRGIVFKRLSLVEPPKRPGVAGADFEIVETSQNGMSQLMETLTTDLKNEMEFKEKMRSKVVVSTEKRVVADATKLKEQNEEPSQADAATPERCDAGSHWDEEKQECVPDEPAAKPEKVAEQTQQGTVEPHVEPAKHCPDGFTYNEETGMCDPEEWKAEPTAQTPAPLTVPEPTIEPAKVPAPPIPAPAAATGPIIEQEKAGMPAPLPRTGLMKEVKLPELLPFGEWFGKFPNLDACKAANQDKSDPTKYCMSIHRKIEGETMRETAMESFPLLAEMDKATWVRDRENAEAINSINKATAKIVKELAGVPAAINSQIALESKLRAERDGVLTANLQTIPTAIESSIKAMTEYINKFVPTSIQQNTNQILEYREKLAQTQSNHFETLIKSLSECSQKSDASIATFAKSVKEQVEQQKRDYESILNAVDAKYKKFKEEYKTLEQRVKEQEDELDKRKCPDGEHYDEEQQKCVADVEPEEVKEMRAKLEQFERIKAQSLAETESLTVRVDNLEAGLKGTFKGHRQPVEKKVSYSRPEEEMRESAKKRK